MPRACEAGLTPAHDPEVNMVFIALDGGARGRLRQEGLDFGRDGEAPVRLCTSWCTREEEIDRLVGAIAA